MSFFFRWRKSSHPMASPRMRAIGIPMPRPILTANGKVSDDGSPSGAGFAPVAALVGRPIGPVLVTTFCMLERAGESVGAAVEVVCDCDVEGTTEDEEEGVVFSVPFSAM